MSLPGTSATSRHSLKVPQVPPSSARTDPVEGHSTFRSLGVAVSPHILRRTQWRLQNLPSFINSRWRKAKTVQEMVTEKAVAAVEESPVPVRAPLRAETQSSGEDLSPAETFRVQWRKRDNPQFRISVDEPDAVVPDVAVHGFTNEIMSGDIASPSTVSSEPPCKTSAAPAKSMRDRFARLKTGSRNNSSQSTAYDVCWSSAGDLKWVHVHGYELVLHDPCPLQLLSSLERDCLQKVALEGLKRCGLDCPITRPKVGRLKWRRKPPSEKPPFMKKRSQTTWTLQLSGVFHVAWLRPYFIISASICSEGAGPRMFGVTISECLAQETQLSFDCPPFVPSHSPNLLDPEPPGLQQRCRSLDLDESRAESLRIKVVHTNEVQKSARSSHSSLSEKHSSTDSATHCTGPHTTSLMGTIDSNDDLNLSVDMGPFLGRSHSTASSVLTGGSSCGLMQEHTQPRTPQVPKIVLNCCQFIREYGCHTVGLFRIAGSVRRCKELKGLLDSGSHSVADLLDNDSDTVSPHDIATLLKEYLRDLPDCLLTYDLHAPFIACAKLAEAARVTTIRLMVCLLPPENVDTLLVLLRLLGCVAERAEDGDNKPGNRMTARNLATVFAPTLLRPPDNQGVTLEQSEAAIDVLETMITHCEKLFLISKELHQDTLRVAADNDPEGLDQVLTRLYTAQNPTEPNDQLHRTTPPLSSSCSPPQRSPRQLLERRFPDLHLLIDCPEERPLGPEMTSLSPPLSRPRTKQQLPKSPLARYSNVNFPPSS